MALVFCVGLLLYFLSPLSEKPVGFLNNDLDFSKLVISSLTLQGALLKHNSSLFCVLHGRPPQNTNEFFVCVAGPLLLHIHSFLLLNVLIASCGFTFTCLCP